MSLRTVFVGAVEGSLTALGALAAAGLPPRLVVTLPPGRAARHSDYADLAPAARAAGAATLFSADVNADETIGAIRDADADLLIVVGWSQICRAPFRASARLGAIGFHPAPLPRLRGRAVIPWTILLGETETAATLFWLDEGVDSGDLLLQRRFALAAEETARSLYDRHLAALATMLPEAVRLVAAGDAPRVPQDHARASWCAKRTPEDGRIDWRAPGAEVLRLIRAVGEPYPGAFTTFDGERIVIERARALEHPERFVGLPGQVQKAGPDAFAVRCGDGACVEVLAWRSPSGRAPKIHAKLGEAPR
jgi:methionyl-tRNA formyltransferase